MEKKKYASDSGVQKLNSFLSQRKKSVICSIECPTARHDVCKVSNTLYSCNLSPWYVEDVVAYCWGFHSYLDFLFYNQHCHLLTMLSRPIQTKSLQDTAVKSQV